MKRVLSEQVYQENCKVIPGGVNSPIRACLEMGVCPLIIDSAKGDTLIDVDGNKYIDYCCSWGALIHGHAHEDIEKGIYAQVKKGTSYGITSPLEGALAKKVCALMPAVEKIRFVSSGTEATMTAVRLARAYTGKSLTLKFSGNYHGHADCFLVKAGSGVVFLPDASSAGIPKEVISSTLCFPYNDFAACEKVFNDPKIYQNLAAVIIEPIAANMGLVPPKKEFLEMLRQKCKRVGALLIFDEVITGFRVSQGGAQQLYSIEPDLTCLGKIIGAGFPAAAVGGKKEIMNLLAPLGHVFQAGTLSGNPIAMQAGCISLELLKQKGFYEELQRKANLIILPVREYIEKHAINACIQHVASLFSIFFGRKEVFSVEEVKECDQQKFKEFFKYMLEQGVYIPPSQYEAWFLSQAHTEEHLIKTKECILSFLKNNL